MLEELMALSSLESERRAERVSFDLVEKQAEEARAPQDAYSALKYGSHIRVIAEIKRASPSAGNLASIDEPAELAAKYQEGGAAAISVLTQEKYFRGSLDDLYAVRKRVAIPVLRKDFISTIYQIFEARAAGADLILLIVAALETKKLRELFELATQLGMQILLEVHTRDELARACDLGGSIIGVNARDLKTFECDTRRFGELAGDIPADAVKVAESAIKTVADVQLYRQAGADAVLVGQTLVTNDPVKTLKSFLEVT